MDIKDGLEGVGGLKTLNPHELIEWTINKLQVIKSVENKEDIPKFAEGIQQVLKKELNFYGYVPIVKAPRWIVSAIKKHTDYDSYKGFISGINNPKEHMKIIKPSAICCTTYQEVFNPNYNMLEHDIIAVWREFSSDIIPEDQDYEYQFQILRFLIIKKRSPLLTLKEEDIIQELDYVKW